LITFCAVVTIGLLCGDPTLYLTVRFSSSYCRLRHRLLARLAQRFLEALRQRVAARLLGGDRLLERGFAPRRLLGEDTFGVAQLRPRPVAHGFAVPDDPLQVGVHHQGGAAARARNLEFGREFRHG
jgi:hypothetical protein